jgi:hypothetical protein
MNKSQLHTLVMQLCEEHKANKKLIGALDELLKPKSGGGIVQNPMQTINGVNYHYCRYADIYVIESEIVMSNGKSKGYSKKAIAEWTRLGKEVQNLNAQAMAKLLDGDIAGGTKIAADAEALKLARNTPDLYLDIKQYFIDNSLSI